jgi:hypothetical protein
MNTRIYDKTARGREEIATRKYQVPPKLRTLLVMIDGRHTLGSLLKNFAALGLSEDHVEELLSQQYITLVSGGPEPVAPEPEAPAAPRPPASARARMLARTAARQGKLADAEREGPATEPMPEREARAPAEAQAGPADGPERFRALYDFYNQTIKSTIGLRGIALQLKVERAASIDDFRALRLPYLQAVLKSKGREMALSLRDRLDHLLGGKPGIDDFALPGENSPATKGALDYFNLASESVNF